MSDTTPSTARPSKRGAVLAVLQRAAPSGRRVEQIAAEAGCAHITVRRHVALLEEQGLVVCERDPQPRPRRADGRRRAGHPYYEYKLV